MKSNQILFYVSISLICILAIGVFYYFLFQKKSTPNIEQLLSTTISSKIPELTTDMCEYLALCMPDHQMEVAARDHFTKQYLRAWDLAYNMPDLGQYAGYIGDNEWLYYFVSGNGDCGKVSVHITDISLNSSSATISFDYLFSSCPNATHHHTMQLSYMDNQWLISNFDDTFTRLQQFVTNTVKTYREDKVSWVQSFEDPNALNQYIHDMDVFIDKNGL